MVESAGTHLVNQAFKKKSGLSTTWREVNEEVNFRVEYKKRYRSLELRLPKVVDCSCHPCQAIRLRESLLLETDGNPLARVFLRWTC